MSERAKIAVLGGGAWGTALAAMAAISRHDTWLYARDTKTVEHVNNERRNPAYLGEIELPEGIRASTDAKAVFQDADIVLVVVPAQECVKGCRN